MKERTGAVPVSILIPIKNEAVNLPRCLASVEWANEVIVVDSNSTDASLQIAESYGAKTIQFHFCGTWPKKKNWALDNVPFKNEWIFLLDADEVMPPEAKDEIGKIVSSEQESDFNGYWVNRRFLFMGKWLKHAYYPNWNLRLFKHKCGRFEKLTDIFTASGDNEVHEHLIVTGKTGYLKFEMDHFAFPTIEVFIEKHNRYSNWEARVYLENQRKGDAESLQSPVASSARKLRKLSQFLPCRPLLRFLYVYLFQKGFLDGMEGYYFARLHGFYEFLIVAKTYELNNQNAAKGDKDETR
jgi:glycosyltransferase involved in cell wall biosynthesis